MSVKIKEIREYISCPQFGDDHYGKWGALRLEQRIKIKQLLDYITTLQEENKEAHDFDETMKDIKDNLIARINRQEKEIQELKAQLEMYENGVYFSSENDKLQERIDKATEHLKEVMKDEEEYEEDYIYNKYLLDILQGSEKE